MAKTGVIALLKRKYPGKTILLRADMDALRVDMDALRVDEETDV